MPQRRTNGGESHSASTEVDLRRRRRSSRHGLADSVASGIDGALAIMRWCRWSLSLRLLWPPRDLLPSVGGFGSQGVRMLGSRRSPEVQRPPSLRMPSRRTRLPAADGWCHSGGCRRRPPPRSRRPVGRLAPLSRRCCAPPRPPDRRCATVHHPAATHRVYGTAGGLCLPGLSNKFRQLVAELSGIAPRPRTSSEPTQYFERGALAARGFPRSERSRR